MTIGLPDLIFDWIVGKAKIHNMTNSAYARQLLVAAFTDRPFLKRVERKILTSPPKSSRSMG